MLSKLIIMSALYHHFHLSSLTFPIFHLITILFQTVVVYSIEYYHLYVQSDKRQGRASASQTQRCLYSFNTPIAFLMSSVRAAENTPQTQPHLKPNILGETWHRYSFYYLPVVKCPNKSPSVYPALFEWKGLGCGPLWCFRVYAREMNTWCHNTIQNGM